MRTIEVTKDEGVLILDALALAIEAAEWTAGEKQDDFMNLYQKLGPQIITEDTTYECDESS